ncbi:benzoate/H(+) symporter BenE family transporter [Massilia sp. METH4]|uniref:benzoate/H(+) symporter BenE family transporter n=1 Tax=Massilia sp. METH4 TaxID=3123041 RepID=UPI0030D409E2
MSNIARPDVARGRQHAMVLPAIVAGFLAVLVSFAGPLAIFYQAAQAARVDAHTFASWVWGISVGAGVAGIFLSIRYKVPVITAWSAPGTALLITLFPALSVQEAVGAYIVAAAILLALGATGSVDRIMRHIPQGVAAGMMAGILLPFGLKAFSSVGTLPVIAGSMIAVYLLCRRVFPRYTVVMVLAAGVILAVGTGRTDIGNVGLALAVPKLIVPVWTWSATFSLAIPLVLVTLTGQYLPGMALLNTSGYDISARPVMTTNSAVSLLVAVTGGITIAIAAITAAMCTGPDAHEDPRKRYVAGLANGGFYLLAGLCAGSIVALFAALPQELVATVAGLALLGPIAANLAIMTAAPDREAALITFVATASGITFMGLGAAFWGIATGIAAHFILARR